MFTSFNPTAGNAVAVDQLIEFVFDFTNSDVYVYVNGTNEGSDTNYVNKTDSTQFRVNAKYNLADQWADLDVAEIVVVPNDITQETRERYEGYLAWKWGLMGFLPAAHPFKSAPPKTRLWTASEISTGSWYDAADEGTITEASGKVSQWDDKSGNGNDVTQSTEANKPISNTRTQNGLRVLDFSNANNSKMENNSPSGWPTTDVDIFYVFKRDDAAAGRYMGTFDGTGGEQYRINRFSDYSFDGSTTAGGFNRTDAAGDTNPHILNGRWSGTNVGLWIDGTQTVADAARAGTVTIDDYIRIGANAFGAESMDGWIGEIIITDYLSDADRQRVEGYLAHKWGLEANLPASHPYRYAAPLVAA